MTTNPLDAKKDEFQFFFSYARTDSDKYLIRFFTDLCDEVYRRTGISRDQKVGFRDTSNIKTGDTWSLELKDALQKSRVFISIASPTYINRDFCGKEFQVFKDRLDRYRKSLKAGAKPPRVMLPVVWYPVVAGMPDAIKKLQLDDDELPAEYKDEGLRYMMQLRKYSDQYKKFLSQFAKKVIESANTATLPSLDPPPEFENVQSAFHKPSAQVASAAASGKPIIAEATETNSSGGPNVAKFVFVVAKQKEIKENQVKQDANNYDDNGGWFWRPYFPGTEDRIGLIAQDVASSEKLKFVEMPLNKNIVQKLKEAKKKNEIVVIIVDGWTIRLPKYREIINRYDGQLLLNCAVLVPWNEQDNETTQKWSLLQNTLQITFPAKIAAKHPIYFNDSIRSVEELREGLQKTLSNLQMKIIDANKAEKIIELEPRPLSIIQGPSGDSL